MAGVSLNVTSVKCSDALGILAPGDGARISVTVENGNAKTVTKVRLWLECLDFLFFYA